MALTFPHIRKSAYGWGTRELIGNGKSRSRFPEGMTERKAKARAKATAEAVAGLGVAGDAELGAGGSG